MATTKSHQPEKKLRQPSGDLALGKVIRSARKAKHLTLDEVGKAVGKTAGAISQYETGQIDIDPDTRVRLAIELGIPQEAFFKAPEGMVVLSDEDRLFLARWQKAPHALRQAILLILDSVPKSPTEPN